MNIILNSAMFSSNNCTFSENFIHNNTIIKVQLTPTKINIHDRFGMHVLPIDNQTFFKTEIDFYNNLTKISIIGEKVVHLGHSNPTVLEQWSLLLSHLMHQVDFHKDYEIIEKVGKGVSSSVFKARKPGKQGLYAVKVFVRKLMSEKDVLAFQNEIRILKTLNHPYFPSLISTYISQQKYYLIMKFVEGINLKEFIKHHKMEYLQKRRIFIEIAKALKKLHEIKIVHRDIKPQNIIYNPKNGSLHLLDFGFSSFLQSKTVIYSNCGTPGYSAPESYANNYFPSPAGDLFSLGILGYFLFFHSMPYQAPATLLIDNRDCNFKFSKQLQKSPTLQNLLKKMICHQSMRISIDQFFTHPFVTGKEEIYANPQAIFWHRKIQKVEKAKKEKQWSKQLRQRGISMALRSQSKTKFESPLAFYNKRLVTDRY